MTISIWRYSHLILAVSSFLLLILASVTGVILSFEPVLEKTYPYKVSNFSEITLAEVIPNLKNNFSEVNELSVDANQFVKIKGTDLDGESVEVFVNPKTAEVLGNAHQKSEFFQWINNLHRSLFLKETGRFLIGFTSFLLFLIAISGSILIIKRQRGIKHFFQKIVKEDFSQYYHVYLGRLLLIPILLISLTGAYLSMERFGLITKQTDVLDVDFDKIKSTPEKDLKDFEIFNANKLIDVKSIEFPFSDDVEDYFIIKFTDREIAVNQITGEILAEIKYSTSSYLTELSLDLHTGRTSILWAIILAIASANILFFIYSGFAITWRRISKKTKNKFKAEDSNIIILVGSENGSTLHTAQIILEQLIKSGQKAYLTELNKYQVFTNAQHFIIFAATYGLGDATTNASNFIKLLDKYSQVNNVKFSVLGFGSKSYPDFCKFAFDIYQKLSQLPWAKAITDVHTVNDKSPADILLWTETWAQQSNIQLSISPELLKIKQPRLSNVIVSEKLTYKTEDIFTVKLKTLSKLKVKSGDLLAIYPANDHRERLYSIGVINKEINLSVRLHPNGIGSEYLFNLQSKDRIKVKLVNNNHFHFPKKSVPVVMIANGTGIAPFLGMISENKKNNKVYLFCGFRNSTYLEPYKEILEKGISESKLDSYKLAYSREKNGHYVNELIVRDAQLIANVIKNKGVIMICGSLNMERDVMEKLEDIFQNEFGKGVSHYQSSGQILTDCY